MRKWKEACQDRRDGIVGEMTELVEVENVSILQAVKMVVKVIEDYTGMAQCKEANLHLYLEDKESRGNAGDDGDLFP